ncbi:uncharacterized protein SPSK_00174 [Sporothrix schenckii 1099-18]|uniref:Uncharacterized protein n=1 Tax=Sporothrix schenckii 1099-18 TaxID=1397361 RepID=A0A0F2M1U8_SPOSC|nr:uncharacterized protein SPSK_00174 [Sporothrix schenckii 1099-18]KJR83688.1 hypothetical protein SPSK_00174 [Sporothrix schenckii 1099-18]
MAFLPLALFCLASGFTLVNASTRPPYEPVPACPPCFTSTVWTQGVCGKPRCTTPTTKPTPTPTPTPAPALSGDCTVTVTEAEPPTTTIVANTNVCSVFPTITQSIPCPPAPACDDDSQLCKTVWIPAMNTGPDSTTYISNCVATITPWIQPLPPGYTPTPPLPPSYPWPSSVTSGPSVAVV